jgi:hypothetical protein
MSGDSGPPRSETNTNGDVPVAFSFRSADTSSRSRVWRCRWNPSAGRDCDSVEEARAWVEGEAAALRVRVIWTDLSLRAAA